MSLTQEQSMRVASDRLAIRVAKTKEDLKAGYGLYTPRNAAEMTAWLKTGPPADWYDQLFNTGLFTLAMRDAKSHYLLFVTGGGDPQGERYPVAHLQGGRGSQMTLPKVNALDPGAKVTACVQLGVAPAESPDAISNWVIQQI
jgi:hypothetical protein